MTETRKAPESVFADQSMSTDASAQNEGIIPHRDCTPNETGDGRGTA